VAVSQGPMSALCGSLVGCRVLPGLPVPAHGLSNVSWVVSLTTQPSSG